MLRLDLPKNNQTYLLAMSGGVDSCVLFDLLVKHEVTFDVAHVNFKLRGEESDMDEWFVKKLCESHQIKAHIKTLDVNDYKLKNNVSSTQIIARDLRYDWFEKLRDEYSYDFILTAHHLNDSIETFFINLLRGTGLNGLLGIKNQKHILRPLLPFSKQEIYNYARRYSIQWREDSSNQSDDYLRNALRHHVVPALKNIDYKVEQSFYKTISNLEDDYGLLQDYIADLWNDLSFSKNGITYLNINQLKTPKYQKAIYHLFSPYGFNHPSEIKKLISGNNSSEIKSDSLRMIKDREYLLITPIVVNENISYDIVNLNTENLPIYIRLNATFTDTNAKVVFDFNKIKFPLSLRHQKIGDIFYPKGMNGRSKKVSKYFKDLKLSKIEKENTWLLCDADDKVLWIVGHRQDSRFLPTNKTTKWLIAED